MPNHVRNVVRMQGITGLPLFTEEQGEIRFDFNKIIPMPESLEIESGSMTDEGIMYFLTERCTIPLACLGKEESELVKKLIGRGISRGSWTDEVFRRTMEKAYHMRENYRDKMYEAGRIYISNYKNYGATTWYDWRCDNWGTKWNAYSNEQVDENTLSFETAWSNPEPIMIKLSEMYPDAEIEHWWADEDMGRNAGHRIYRGGEIAEGDYFDSDSNEAYGAYIKCWGKSECLCQDEKGDWYHKDCDTCHGCD